MAGVAGVVEEGGWRGGAAVPVHVPVGGGEERRAADGEDERVHAVERDGFEDHGFRAETGRGGDEGFFRGTGVGGRVGGVAVLGGEADYRVGGRV